MIWLVASLIKPFAICPGGIQSEITSVSLLDSSSFPTQVFSNQVFQMESRGLDIFLFSGFVFCNLSCNCSKELTVLAFHIKEALSWRHSFSEEIPSSDPSPSRSNQVAWNTLYTQFLNSRPFRNMVLPMSLPWLSAEREWGLIICAKLWNC